MLHRWVFISGNHLMGVIESLAGVWFSVSTGSAAWLKALYESYRVIRGVFNLIAYHGGRCVEVY